MESNSLWIKVFECDGGQVAYMLDHDDDGTPILLQKTLVNDVFFSIGGTFEDTDEGHEARDNAFAGINQEKADKFIALAKEFTT